ncbi:SGNH/GDSL hydrolase family protein [Planosporangium mesophilum]|uniref:SGNH/GDSL hydrolase family protein n=1 Tax=Planosporangium mesophilum TaxID=689768 RepID=UPI00143A9E00|nr:SGNH/GDSL hydrolase family protein [Planosporangium mesophilum]NJC86363.1 SGNH/GDSL hydrolase family protein [Planosporangium mesophilum]
MTVGLVVDSVPSDAAAGTVPPPARIVWPSASATASNPAPVRANPTVPRNGAIPTRGTAPVQRAWTPNDLRHLPRDRPLRILGCCDSMTPGCTNTDTDQGYWTELGRLLDAAGVRYECSNASIGGQSTVDVVGYIRNVVRAARPDVILINVMTNDAAGAESKARYQRILDDIFATDPNVVVAPTLIEISRVPPAPAWLANSEPANNAAIRDVCLDGNGAPRHPRIVGLGNMSKIPNNTKYVDGGGIHFTPAGQVMAAREWYRTITPWFGLPPIPQDVY